MKRMALSRLAIPVTLWAGVVGAESKPASPAIAGVTVSAGSFNPSLNQAEGERGQT